MKRVFIPLAALSLAVSAGALLAQTQAAPAGPQVAVIELRAQSVQGGFELDGVIEPVRQATVSAQASGRIASLAVKAGDRVRAGQVLAMIDDRETQTGVARSGAQVAEADANLVNARAHFERSRELRQQGFVSQAALDAAQAQFAAAQAGREQATAGARQATLAQGFTRVTAPFDGYVRDTLSEAGDLAVPGKPVLVMYAPTPIRAVVQVGASRAALAHAATRVEVQAPSGNWIQPARTQALPVADAISQTIEWRLELGANAGADLVPGQQVKVRFAAAPASAASQGTTGQLLVPQQAILRRGELTGVYVVREATSAGAAGFVLKAIRLGADRGSAGVEVLAGLDGGARIALDPVRAGLAGATPAANGATKARSTP